MEVLSKLFSSRRFWTAILDMVISMVLYFVGKYSNPSLFEDIKFLIGVIQVPAGLLIVAFTVEDAARIKGAAMQEVAMLMYGEQVADKEE